MARLAPTPQVPVDPRAAAVFQAVADLGQPVSHLYRTLAHAPAMLQAWTALAWPLRTECRAPRGLRELVILQVARLTGAGYEWAHHVPFALQHGVTQEQVAQLQDWQQATCFDELERATLAAVESLVTEGTVPQERYAALRELVDEQELVELVLTASFYVCVARVLATFDVDLEPEYAVPHQTMPQPTQKAHHEP